MHAQIENRYIIVGNPRSGTTLIQELLRGHPQSCSNRDELKTDPFFTKGFSVFTLGNDASDEPRRIYPRLFDAIAAHNATPTTRTCGLKVSEKDPKKAKILAATIQEYFPEMHVIHVVRKDLVAQYGSLLRAWKTRVFHTANPGVSSNNIEVTIKKEDFFRYVVECIESQQEIRALNGHTPFCEITYEDIISDAASIYKDIYQFLKIDNIDPEWVKSCKVSPNPAEYIVNYDEMKAFQANIEAQFSHYEKTYKTIKEPSAWYLWLKGIWHAAKAPCRA